MRTLLNLCSKHDCFLFWMCYIIIQYQHAAMLHLHVLIFYMKNNNINYLWYSIFSNATSACLLQISSTPWLGSHWHFRLCNGRLIGKVGRLNCTALLRGHAPLSRGSNEGLGGVALVEFAGLMETHFLVDCITGMLIIETWVREREKRRQDR